MPYLITTTQRTPVATYVTSRRAVATLEDARASVERAVLNTRLPRTVYKFARQARVLPESGGTVGPLPDGTVIEVEPVEWDGLLDAWIARLRHKATNAEILDAYNAREGS